MATFAGIQPGYPEPTIEHEAGLKAYTAPVTFAGKQAGQADPTIIGGITRLDDKTK